MVHETSYPVEWLGNFESNDPLLNQIWKTGAETARLCMQDTYMDSPWRERAQWWDNVAVASRVAYYAFGDVWLLAQAIKHIAVSQEPSGAALALYPSSNKAIFPDFGALWVMSVWDHYAESGDLRFLTDMYPAVVRWLRWIEKFRNEEGLLSDVEGDVFIDWGSIDRRGEVAALNIFYIGALRAASKMADVVRRGAEAEEWAGVATRVKNVIARDFWSPERGLYADARVEGKLQGHYSKQTNALAALFNIPDHYQKASIFRQILDDRGLPAITTPYFTTYVVEALCASGNVVEALELIRRKWGSMLSSGATTFWEFFTPEGTLCQGSASAPTYILQSNILGVVPEGRRVRIEPNPGDLAWARGVVPTPAGPVRVDWKVGKHGFAMTLKVPQGLTAVIAAPRNSSFTRVLVDSRDVSEPEVEVGSGVHLIQVMGEPKPRHRRQVEPVEVEKKSEPTPIPPGRGDIEYVVQMIQILTELEKEQTTAEEEPASEDSADRFGDKRRRSRRRSRHKRGPGEETEPMVTEARGEAPEAPVEAVPEPAAEVEAAPTSERRRPRRRGRRSSGRSAEAEPVQEAQTVVEEAQPVAAEAPTGPEPASERRGPRRRGRRSPSRAPQGEGEPTEAVVEVQAVVEESQPAPAETHSESEPAQERRRPRRRGRRSSGRPTETESQAEGGQTTVEQVVEQSAPSVEASAPISEPRPPRRRGRSQPKSDETSSQPSASPEAPQVAHWEPKHAPEPASPAESGSEPPKRRRSKPRNTQPQQAEESQAAPVEAVSAGEPSAEPGQHAEGNGKKPYRRPRRTRKPSSQDDKPEEATAVEG
jgi:hypothetical protein